MSVPGFSNKLWVGIVAIAAITLYFMTPNKKPKRKSSNKNDDDHKKSKTNYDPNEKEISNNNRNVNPNIILEQETDEDIFQYMLNEYEEKEKLSQKHKTDIDPPPPTTTELISTTEMPTEMVATSTTEDIVTTDDLTTTESIVSSTTDALVLMDSEKTGSMRRLSLSQKQCGQGINEETDSDAQNNITTKTTPSDRSVWCIGRNMDGQWGIGNKITQKQLVKCGWSQKIQIRNIYAALDHTVVEDMDGNYYSAGFNQNGACTVNDKSNYILNMTPITDFKQNSINCKISQVFVNNAGDAPFWKAEDESIYTSCKSNYHGRIGVEVDKNKAIHKIPFLSQLSIKKMVSGWSCSIAICNDGSVYSTGTGYYKRGENGLGEEGTDNRSWRRIECLNDIIDCDFGGQFVIFLSKQSHVFSAGINNKGQLGLNTQEYNYGNKKHDEHIMRNPTEITWFRENNPNSSKYVNAMTDQLKCVTQLSDIVVDIISTYLPSFMPIRSISCCQEGVIALDCCGNVYQWGNLTGLYGDDILCPQQVILEDKVASVETGEYHYICRTEKGQFISIGCGDDGECCRENVKDLSPQIINGWILNQIGSKETAILSVIPRWRCTFILVSNTDGLDEENYNENEEASAEMQ